LHSDSFATNGRFPVADTVVYCDAIADVCHVFTFFKGT